MHARARSLARFLVAAPAAAVTVLACSCLPELGFPTFEAGDLRPPSLLSWDLADARTLELRFDEEVLADAGDFALDPAPGPLAVSGGPDGRGIAVGLPEGLEPGADYALSGLARDAAGNAVRFVLPFAGWNGRVPPFLLNELLLEASTTHLDAIELLALADGNLAGVVAGSGKPSDPAWAWRLPAVEVRAGDLVALHLRPKGLPEEVDELEADGGLDASGGLDAEPTARDLWYRGGDGALPGANGVAWARRSPTGPVVDAAFWCERTSASDERYAGFGSAELRDAVGELAAAGAWAFEGSAPRPEDGVASAWVTATRTLCRVPGSPDTGGKADWFVVATGKESLGLPNSAEAYAP